MAGKGPSESQTLIGQLHAAGWTDSAIGAAVGRNSSLIHQGATGAKPLNNLTGALRELASRGGSAPKSSKEARSFAPKEQPAPRVTSRGTPARVREPREAQAARRAERGSEAPRRSSARHIGRNEFAKARELPNGQKSITGHTVASARFAAGVAGDLSDNARVKVVYKGADGEWHTLGKKGGIRPEKLREYAKGMRGGASMASMIQAMLDDFYAGGEEPDDSGDVEFYVVDLGA
jgi:hypothetical protein